MSDTIKGVFDKYVGDLKIDRRFIKQINQIRIGFVNRNNDHLEFFSGNLLGVNPVRYRTSDREEWFDEVLEVDEIDVAEALVKLDSIDSSWVRAKDPVNMSCIWLLHQIHNSRNLSPKDKERGLTDVVLMLQYKFLSSVMAHYFPYPADQEVAKATYEALSQKFDIKRHGSWQALLESRTESILSPNSIHYNTYTKMRNDADVIYMVSDIQARLKEVVKKMTQVFHRVKEQNLRISSTSSVIELDGVSETLDRSRDHTRYTRYIHEIISDKPSFVRGELVEVVGGVLHTMPEKLLTEALEYCSDNYGRRGDPNVAKLVDEVLLHAFAYLSENQGVMASPSDLVGLVGKLKNLYMASRMSDPALISMRELSEKIIGRSVTSRNKAVLASVRTGLQIYIVLRAFSMKHYQG